MSVHAQRIARLRRALGVDVGPLDVGGPPPVRRDIALRRGERLPIAARADRLAFQLVVTGDHPVWLSTIAPDPAAALHLQPHVGLFLDHGAGIAVWLGAERDTAVTFIEYLA